MANIRAFQKQDTARVISAMTGGFANDPLYRYFIPEDAARDRGGPLGYAVGTTHLIPGKQPEHFIA